MEQNFDDKKENFEIIGRRPYHCPNYIRTNIIFSLKLDNEFNNENRHFELYKFRRRILCKNIFKIFSRDM